MIETGSISLTSISVWQQVLQSLANVRSIFAETDASPGLKAFTLKLVSNAVKHIGWEFAPGEDLLTGQLRALLIQTAGMAGDKEYAATSNSFSSRPS
jgi:ERAP1-like C-terminal domain